MEASREMGLLNTNPQEVDSTEAQIQAIHERMKKLGINSYNIALTSDGTPVVKDMAVQSEAVQRIAAANPANIQEVAASNLNLTDIFYKNVNRQAILSFTWALIAASVGLVFFAVAILLPNAKAPGVIGGALVELLAGTFLVLHARSQSQLASFHHYLDRTQRFLLANSVAEQLDDSEKQLARTDLVHIIANAPMTEDTEQKTAVKTSEKAATAPPRKRLVERSQSAPEKQS
jgi:hypothetical protein